MMVGEADRWVERAVEIRKVKRRERCSQPGGCKHQAAVWLTYQYGTPGRLNPGRNGCYCNAHGLSLLKIPSKRN